MSKRKTSRFWVTVNQEDDGISDKAGTLKPPLYYKGLYNIDETIPDGGYWELSNRPPLIHGENFMYMDESEMYVLGLDKILPGLSVGECAELEVRVVRRMKGSTFNKKVGYKGKGREGYTSSDLRKVRLGWVVKKDK